MSESRPTHRVDIQQRFADTDALGHLNNASYVVHAETARLAFLAQLGTSVESLILARIAVDFRRQVVWGEPVVVETWVERIGTTSVTLGQTIRAAGEVAADVDSVVVSYDYATRRSAPWSDEARASLAVWARA